MSVRALASRFDFIFGRNVEGEDQHAQGYKKKPLLKDSLVGLPRSHSTKRLESNASQQPESQGKRPATLRSKANATESAPPARQQDTPFDAAGGYLDADVLLAEIEKTSLTYKDNHAARVAASYMYSGGFDDGIIAPAEAFIAAYDSSTVSNMYNTLSPQASIYNTTEADPEFEAGRESSNSNVNLDARAVIAKSDSLYGHTPATVGPSTRMAVEESKLRRTSNVSNADSDARAVFAKSDSLYGHTPATVGPSARTAVEESADLYGKTPANVGDSQSSVHLSVSNVRRGARQKRGSHQYTDALGGLYEDVYVETDSRFSDGSDWSDEDDGISFSDPSSASSYAAYGGDSPLPVVAPTPQKSVETNSREHKTNFFLTCVTGAANRNWNEEFQTARTYVSSQILNTVNPAPFREFSALCSQFADTASVYARIIVSELSTPDELKTIKPVGIGGVAGGTKYIHNNILFKFATDTCISGDPSSTDAAWMYGGKGQGPSDFTAMKAANNEMKGLEICSTTGVYELCVPMMIVVRYKGFCVLAMPLLPVGSRTLRHGSSDGGLTVHNDDPVLEDLLKTHGKQLNLQPHKTGLREQGTAYMCGDIEVHKGTDGRYYVLDFGRVLPPEDPRFRARMLGDENNIDPRAVFHVLLRPEFVKNYKEPLCSDAFTRWNGDPDATTRQQYNAAVTEATRELYEGLIPAFALELDEVKLCDGPFCTHTSGEGAEHRAHEETHHKGDFTHKIRNFQRSFDYVCATRVHADGLNIRHLGAVRSLCTNPDVRRLILTLLVARCLKTEIEARMRKRMRCLGVPSDTPFKQDVIAVLNLGTGGFTTDSFCDRKDQDFGAIEIDTTGMTGAELRKVELERNAAYERRAARFWRGTETCDIDVISGSTGKYGDHIGTCMRAALMAKFGDCLNAEESKFGTDLRQFFDVQAAMFKALEFLCIRLSARAMKALLVGQRYKHAFFFESDIEQIGARTKTMHTSPLMDGQHMLLEAPLLSNVHARARMAKLACTSMKTAHCKAPLCPFIVARLGCAEARSASLKKRPMATFRSAVRHFDLSKRYAPFWDWPLVSRAQTLRDCAVLLGVLSGESQYGFARESPAELDELEKLEIQRIVETADAELLAFTESSPPPLPAVVLAELSGQTPDKNAEAAILT